MWHCPRSQAARPLHAPPGPVQEFFWVLCTQAFLHPSIFRCFTLCSIPPRSSPFLLSLLRGSHPSSSRNRVLLFVLHHPPWLFPPSPHRDAASAANTLRGRVCTVHMLWGQSARLCSTGRGGPKQPQCNRDSSTAPIPHPTPPQCKESIANPLPSHAEEAHAWRCCPEQAWQSRGSASAFPPHPQEGLPWLLAPFPELGKKLSCPLSHPDAAHPHHVPNASRWHQVQPWS